MTLIMQDRVQSSLVLQCKGSDKLMINRLLRSVLQEIKENSTTQAGRSKQGLSPWSDDNKRSVSG